MQTAEFDVMKEKVPYDDQTLVQKYEEVLREIKKRRAYFEESLTNSAEDNYIRVAVSRLAYNLVKEEFDALVQEMKNRGLLADDY